MVAGVDSNVGEELGDMPAPFGEVLVLLERWVYQLGRRV